MIFEKNSKTGNTNLFGSLGEKIPELLPKYKNLALITKGSDTGTPIQIDTKSLLLENRLQLRFFGDFVFFYYDGMFVYALEFKDGDFIPLKQH